MRSKQRQAAAYLPGDCGVDLRGLYLVRTTRPVTFRLLRGHYEASMHRPTRRERLAGWWAGHRWPLLRTVLLSLLFLACYFAFNLVVTAVLALADRIARWA